MRLKRARNVLRLTRNVQNRVDFWGSAPDPAEGANDAPSDSLVVRGFLPSAIAASRLRRLQHPVLGGNCFHHSGGIDATEDIRGEGLRVSIRVSVVIRQKLKEIVTPCQITSL